MSEKTVEFEIEYVYLSRNGERPKQHKHFFDLMAKNVTEAREKFHREYKADLEGQNSFVWVTDIVKIPQS